VLAAVESHLDPDSGIDKSWRRNASLAWMKLCFETVTPFSIIPDIHGKDQVLNRIPIVFKYLQKYGDASTAYEDLRPFVERLDTEERAQLLNLLVSCKIFEDSDEVKGGGTQSDEYLSRHVSHTSSEQNAFAVRLIIKRISGGGSGLYLYIS
jgi:N-terminal acetyltransferase B complex non-catalytic subunit